MKVGFIGSGKVGCSLARWFRHKGICVTGFYSRSDNAKAIQDFIFYSSPTELIRQSDIVFITVTDSAISAVWSGLDKTAAAGKIICHCSGSLSSDIFVDAAKNNIFTCSLHPMQAFDSRSVSFDKISSTFFTIEGSGADKICSLLKQCGSNYAIIDSACKPLYHAAAVFASNFAVALANKAVTLLEQCGFTQDEALQALTPILMSNMDNVCKKGTAEALTGPIERNDIITTEKHLKYLDEDSKSLYKQLARETIQIARLKHPERDYTELYQKLED